MPIDALPPEPITDTPNSLAQRYEKDLQRYLARRLHHAQDVADLAQEVYLRLLRLGKQELANASPAYLYWMASHVVYEFKLKARRALVSFDSEQVEEWAEHPAELGSDLLPEQLNLRRQLESGLRELPPTCRAVLLLHKRDGMTYEEIAVELNLSLHTVKKYVARALAILRTRKWEW